LPYLRTCHGRQNTSRPEASLTSILHFDHTRFQGTRDEVESDRRPADVYLCIIFPPRIPPPLSDYISSLLTCRSFYDAITETIKIGLSGQSINLTLQIIQFERLDRYSEYLICIHMRWSLHVRNRGTSGEIFSYVMSTPSSTIFSPHSIDPTSLSWRVFAKTLYRDVKLRKYIPVISHRNISKCKRPPRTVPSPLSFHPRAIFRDRRSHDLVPRDGV
jgi:hypothetical protein